ncbi:unnamed protein product [Hermetia illucens]|uniref:Uncharacterized protein n=1 Tax=Hermetia illucens TaxID=343691 RepID=A0A7R8YYR7_HERIL|nr:unnamed protein product [Hermetia illucens]
MMETFIVLGLCFILYEALDFFQGCRHSPHQNYRPDDRHLLIDSNESTTTTTAPSIKRKTSKEPTSSLNPVPEENICYSGSPKSAFDLNRVHLINENRNEEYLSSDNDDESDESCDDDESISSTLSSSENCRKVFSISENLDNFNLI